MSTSGVYSCTHVHLHVYKQALAHRETSTYKTSKTKASSIPSRFWSVALSISSSALEREGTAHHGDKGDKCKVTVFLIMRSLRNSRWTRGLLFPKQCPWFPVAYFMVLPCQISVHTVKQTNKKQIESDRNQVEEFGNSLVMTLDHFCCTFLALKNLTPN